MDTHIQNGPMTVCANFSSTMIGNGAPQRNKSLWVIIFGFWCMVFGKIAPTKHCAHISMAMRISKCPFNDKADALAK